VCSWNLCINCLLVSPMYLCLHVLHVSAYSTLHLYFCVLLVVSTLVIRRMLLLLLKAVFYVRVFEKVCNLSDFWAVVYEGGPFVFLSLCASLLFCGCIVAFYLFSECCYFSSWEQCNLIFHINQMKHLTQKSQNHQK